MKGIVVIIGFVFLFSFSAKAESPNSFDSLLLETKKLEKRKQSGALSIAEKRQLGRLYFYLSVEEKDFIHQGKTYLSSLGLSVEFSGFREMYMAGLKALEAKYALWPLEKWQLANEALKEMDYIVKNHLKDPEIRFIRASTCYYLPFFFNRQNQVKEDFLFISKCLIEQKDINTYPTHLLRNICTFILDSGILKGKEKSDLIAYYSSLSK
jgi:hypothetical protein